MKPNILVFDVEATSLHGIGFAVGAVVIEKETGKEIDRFELLSKEGEALAGDWVKVNVLPALKDLRTCYALDMLRSEFWHFYKKHKDTCDIWADCAYPVETNFLEAMYADDPEESEFEMPYPLKDISTLIDVDIDRNQMADIENLRKHHPADDALASATCLLRICKMEYNKL